MHWLCLMPGDDAYPLLFRMCVAIVPCCVSSLLTTPVINSPECEWPQLLAFFQTCWQLSLALQYVCSCHAMLDIKPTDHAFSGFISMWVAAQPHCASRLMTPVPCSLACGWLPCHALYQAYWSCLCMDFQCVSGCCASVHFTPDDTCPWLFSGSVTAVLCWITSLLTAPVLGYLSTLMMPVLQTFRMWVTSDCCPMLCQSLLTTLILGYPCWWCLSFTSTGGEWPLFCFVSQACRQHLFLAIHIDDASFLLFRMCVAVGPCCFSSLLTAPVIDSPACE